MVRIEPVMRHQYKNISHTREFPDAIVPFVVQNLLHAGDGDNALDEQASSIGQQDRQSLTKQKIAQRLAQDVSAVVACETGFLPEAHHRILLTF
jgi:hypothetical protein